MQTNEPISEDERRKRQEAVNYARASVGLEGFKPSEADEQRAARFVSGEIDLSEFVEPAPKWTQSEAVAFESAREVITDMHAILTSQIDEESSKSSPDAARLASLRAERSRLFQERAGLHVHDHAEVGRIRAEYGAKVRSWRAAKAR